MLTVVGLAAVVASCEPGSSRPEPLTAPGAPSASEGDGSYTRVEGALSTDPARVSGWIGASGGTLRVAGHTLAVPAGAVEAPTLFTLTQLPTGYVEVELLATVLDPALGVLDVGSDGFDEPVEVALTYSWATNVDDPGRLVILYLQDGGGVEEVPSTVNTAAESVTAELDHFSRYAMAID